MEYNAITKTCTDAGIRALLFISVGCVLYVWNKVFETNVGHVSSKLDKKEEEKKRENFSPENTMLQSSAIKASSSCNSKLNFICRKHIAVFCCLLGVIF